MTIPTEFRRIKSNRRGMVSAYDIVPVRRFQCLPSKPVSGLYKPITDKAYQFTAKEKGAASPAFVFFTGYDVGDELLGLLGAPLPPLETWEAGFVGDGGGGGGTGGGMGGAPVVDPFNASLLRLLNLFFLRYEFDPAKASGQMFATINSAPGTPQLQIAVALNTVLLKCKVTSTGLVNWLQGQVGNARIRPYNFALLNAHLQAAGVPAANIAIL
ncbi:MAG: hypothetical protein K2X55_12750 [Burkholderiaceae bacterium]|nr:hypothetical protein [Burkholderiaceae bacterium]